jgi:PAS domain S-box-containing protein
VGSISLRDNPLVPVLVATPEYAAFFADGSFCVVACNSQGARLVGLSSPAEADGLDLAAWMQESDPVHGPASVARAREQGEAHGVTHQVRGGDGAPCTYSVVVRAIGGGADPVTGYLAMFKDVTEQHQYAERTARVAACHRSLTADAHENTRRLAAVAADVLGADCVALYRAEGGVLRVRVVSPAPPDLPVDREPRGHFLHDLVLARGREEPLRVVDLDRPETAAPEPLVARLGLRTCLAQPLAYGGRVVGVLAAYFRGTPELSDSHRRLLQELGAALRVEDDRAREREQLVTSEERYRALAEHAPMILYITERDGRVLYVNRRAASLFGRPPEEVVGKRQEELFPPHSAQSHVAKIRDVFDSGTHYFGEERMPRPDGDLWIDVRLVPLQDAQGRPMGVLGISWDITERKRYELELDRAKATAEAASRVKSHFLASVSHELRTPLNSIVGFLSLLGDTPLTEEQSRFLKHAVASSEHLVSVINDVLDFSRIEAGRMELRCAAVDPGAVLQGAAAFLQTRASQKGLTLRTVLPEGGCPVVWADGDKLRQVIVNLVDNAVKFTERGEVVVALEVVARSGGTSLLRFEVTDTGMGISRGDQERLFQAFSQLDSARTRRFGGTGLGLAICKSLVNLMKGTMGVESEPGRGSRFSFTLQVPERPPSDLVPAVRRPPSRTMGAVADPGERLRVLVVEDNDLNQAVLRQVLERAGMACDVAGDGGEAVRLFAQGGYDLVVMDCHMPVMDGFSATKAIREAESGTAHTPIIALTGDALESTEAECRLAGMDGWMAKPVEPAQILRVIRDHLRPRPGAARART